MTNIYQVAELAGVSVATVSRVINNGNHVSEKSRRKVQEAMQILNYVPNQAAQVLKHSRTNLVGLIVPDMGNPVYLEQTKGINDFLKDKNLNLLLTEAGDTSEEFHATFKRLLGARVDGIILCSDDFSKFGDFNSLLGYAFQNDIPLVISGNLESTFECDTVSHNSKEGAFLATQHLLKLGHTRIGLIKGTDILPTAERFEGYNKALIEFGLLPEDELIADGDYHQHSGYSATKKLLQLVNPPTAIFAMNDLMAIGAMLALEDAGMNIPGEMAVIGYDDIIWCSLVRPRLTSVVQHKYESGRKLAEMVYTRITQEYTGSARHLMFTPRLAVRKSTIGVEDM